MNVLTILVVLALASFVIRSATATWSRALAPGNAIRAERRAARVHVDTAPSNKAIIIGIVAGLSAFAWVLA